MTNQLVNSADSHVVEPLDLWQQRLPASLKDRAPRIEEIDGVWRFVVEGMPPRRMGMPSDSDGKKKESKASGFRPGGSDPDLRAKDLDEDGVWGEVLYPTIALFGFMIPDPELRWASARAYNDWLAETFTAASTRFAGAAMIPVQEIDTAVEEIERVAKLGLRSVMLPMQAPEDAPYNLDLLRPGVGGGGRPRHAGQLPRRYRLVAVDRTRARRCGRELRRGRAWARSARSRTWRPRACSSGTRRCTW